MPKTDKIPVAVYLVDGSQFDEDDGFLEITNKIIKWAKQQGRDYNEEPKSDLEYPSYQIRIFGLCKTYPLKWSGFLHNLLGPDSILNSCKNQTYAYVCFIGYENHIFAITGGGGSFAIDRFVSQNFGLEILVRLFDKDSKVIRSIKDRVVTGIVLGQTKHYRGDQKFSDENRFGKIFKEVNAELNYRILTKTFGFSDEDLQRKVSGCMAKSSFQINKAIDFPTLLSLLKKFTEILKLKEKFALNKVALIAKKPQNEMLLKELNNQLILKLYHQHRTEDPFDVDFCHRDFEKYRSASDFQIVIDKDEVIRFNNPPELFEVIQELKRIGCCLDADEFQFKCSVLERVITTRDENDENLTSGPVLDHLHGEMMHNGKTYFFVDGEWYLIHPEFIADLNEECEEILKHCCDEALITETFDVKKR